MEEATATHVFGVAILEFYWKLDLSVLDACQKRRQLDRCGKASMLG